MRGCILPLLIGLGLVGCDALRPSLPAAQVGAPSRFDQRTVPPPIRLVDRLAEATLELHDEGQRDETARGVFPLKSGWERGPRDEGGIWSVKSPVELNVVRALTQPAGLSLLAGDEEVRYRCPARGVINLWCYTEGRIEVSGTVDPGARKETFSLHAERVVALYRRLSLSASGLAPADFARFDLTVATGHKDTTVPGVLLPAPSSATWTLEVPPDARLELSLSLVELGLVEGPFSDGARLIVEIDGAEAATHHLSSGGGFEDVQVDLRDYAGRTIALTLRSETTGDPDLDWVFVGAPIVSSASPDPRRIVVVGMDTTRWTNWTQNGHSRDTTSAMDAFAAGAVLFDRAHTPAPRTRPSFRTATTGKLPLPAMDGPTIGDVLGKAGFLTAGVTANVHLVPRFGFNEGFDSWVYENGATADQEVARAKRWLSTHADRDALMFLHFMDPHVFYDAPLLYKNKFVRSKPGPLEWWMNRWQVLSMARNLTDENRSWLQERYDGEVAYMARYLADFLAWVSGLPGQTLIVVHSDHGEEFFEHGGYEHNHTLYEELVHAMFWWRIPGGTPGPVRSTVPVGLQDIAPTLYDFAGVDPALWSDLDGRSLRALLDPGQADAAAALDASLRARALPIGHLMYDTERWAVVADEHKYILLTASGDEELYDLRADPGELQDLAPTSSRAQLDAHLARLAEATGWPAGPGWRVQILASNEPFSLVFDQPVDAVLLDPETANPHRANVEWGEEPRLRIEQIGAVTLSEEGRVVHFTPGDAPRGTLAVRTGSWTLGGTLVVGDQRTAIPAEGGPVGDASVRLRVSAGPVILPLDHVANHLHTAESGDADAMEALRSLGYVE